MKLVGKVQQSSPGLTEVWRVTDLEAAKYGYAPYSHGFYTLFKCGRYVGFCGTTWADKNMVETSK